MSLSMHNVDPSAPETPLVGTGDPTQRAAEFGQALAGRAKATWAIKSMRLPIVAVALALVGMHLPWISVGPVSVSLAHLAGWVGPTIVLLGVAAGLVLHATSPSRPAWMALTAAGLSFILAVLSTVLTALVWVGADFANTAASTASSLFGSSDQTQVASLGVGGYITTAATVALFISMVRLGCAERPSR